MGPALAGRVDVYIVYIVIMTNEVNAVNIKAIPVRALTTDWPAAGG